MPLMDANTLRLNNPAASRISEARKGNPISRDLDEPWNISTGDENIRAAKNWYMIVYEDGRIFSRGSRISGQFTAQQVNHNVGAKIAENGGFNRQSPIISWLGGNVESFTFQARLFAEHNDDVTARKKYDILNALMKRDPQLGRPPLVLFFWGNIISDGFKCLVESLGNITYDEITEKGKFRGATLNISLKQWTPYKIEQVPVSNTERTPVYIVKDGDTYEMIAYRMYGDPMIGVLLNQMNGRSPIVKNAPVGVTSLKAGEEIKIYPINELRRERVQPKCALLRVDNRLSLMNRRYFFDLRSKVIGIIPKK